MSAATAPKPRVRKKSAESGVDDNGDGVDGAAVTEIKPEGAPRRIFRGVKLPEAPLFSLESASDPDSTIDFTGVSALPGLPALQLAVDGISIHTLPMFFSEILGEEQFEQFKEFANDPENGITLDILIDLAKFLMEVYTGRPTKRSIRS
jgi:hypothetical protein